MVMPFMEATIYPHVISLQPQFPFHLTFDAPLFSFPNPTPFRCYGSSFHFLFHYSLIIPIGPIAPTYVYLYTYIPRHYKTLDPSLSLSIYISEPKNRSLSSYTYRYVHVYIHPYLEGPQRRGVLSGPKVMSIKRDLATVKQRLEQAHGCSMSNITILRV